MEEGYYTVKKAFQEGIEKGKEINNANKERKMKVAKRIKEERKYAGFTQETFAIATGINRITYSGYEIGRAEPTIECLVRIADALKLSLDYLCCRTDKKENKEETENLQEQLEKLSKRIEVIELQKKIDDIKNN